MSKKKADYAVAIMPGKTTTPEEMVATGTAGIGGINSSTLLPSAPGVQTAVDDFTVANDSLAANNKKKADLRLQLSQVEADEVTLARRWGIRRQGVLQAVNVFCDGSKEKVQAFNLGVATRTKLPPAVVPTNLHQAKTRKPTTLVVAWDKTTQRHGYMVQHATNPNDAATYAAPVMCTKARFELPGQTLAATIHLRVLALDPSLPGGQTEYTAWEPVTVGAM